MPAASINPHWRVSQPLVNQEQAQGIEEYQNNDRSTRHYYDDDSSSRHYHSCPHYDHSCGTIIALGPSGGIMACLARLSLLLFRVGLLSFLPCVGLLSFFTVHA